MEFYVEGSFITVPLMMARVSPRFLQFDNHLLAEMLISHLIIHMYMYVQCACVCADIEHVLL